jgi:hypothetical protein
MVCDRHGEEEFSVRTLWGEQIDRDNENRDFLRVGEVKAAVSVDKMVFPPLCPSCLKPNPNGVHAITVPEGYRAGLLHPVYVPHCKSCQMREGLFKRNGMLWAGLVASLVLAVGMLFLVNPFRGRTPDEIRQDMRARGVRPTDEAVAAELSQEGFSFKPATFVTWPYVPFFWIGVAGVVVSAWFIRRKGIWVLSINEDSAIFGFKHEEYADEFRRANRITGTRKSASELKDWEAKLCPFCNRPLQREQEICSFCGRRVAGEEAPQAAGARTPEPTVHQLDEHVETAARETMEALSERATRGGVALEAWPKTIQCQCGRKYRLRHPGTYHCVDPACGRTFIVE